MEIGLYEVASDVLRPAFLSLGVTNADLYGSGNWPSCKDRLKSSVRNGARSDDICFSAETGRVSAAEDLSGNLVMAEMTSSAVKVLKVDHSELALEYDGGIESAVP